MDLLRRGEAAMIDRFRCNPASELRPSFDYARSRTKVATAQTSATTVLAAITIAAVVWPSV